MSDLTDPQPSATEPAMTLREALLSVEFVHGICPACSGTEPDHDADCRIARALSDSRPTGEPDRLREALGRLLTKGDVDPDLYMFDPVYHGVALLLAIKANPSALGERGDPTREPEKP